MLLLITFDSYSSNVFTINWNAHERLPLFCQSPLSQSQICCVNSSINNNVNYYYLKSFSLLLILKIDLFKPLFGGQKHHSDNVHKDC